MLELSISPEEIIFILFSLGMFTFSMVAILSKDTRSSIINFLVASMFVCGFIVLVSETIISITLAIIYVSMVSLFLIMTSNQSQSPSKIGKILTAIILLMFIISVLIYKKSPGQFIVETKNVHYVGIGEITLIMSLIFLFVLSGLISLFAPKEK